MVDVSQIKEGDLVWSFNEDTQKQEWTKVLGVESRQVPSYFDLSWRKKKHHSVTAKVTGDHPFWVVGKGWTSASELVPKAHHWLNNGRHVLNEKSDVLLEIDHAAYVSEMRSFMSRNSSEEVRKAASQRMMTSNPMKSLKVRKKVSDTLRRQIRSGDSPNMLEQMWKRKSFQNIVKKRMRENNPSWSEESHAKSCDRPFGMVSQVEKFVNTVILKNELPFVHNRGSVYIGRRVPDFIMFKKKKVVEVTSPDYLERESNGYHEKNFRHYKKFGYECLTLYVRRSVQEERRVLKRLTEFAYNGREILRKEKVNEPLTVYSIRTENHTFFAEGVLTHNCDSAGTWHPDYVPKQGDLKRMTVSDIVAEVPDNVDFVVITGGEPCIHDLTDLITGLHDRAFAVHLETSGAYELKGSPDWITLSPKRSQNPLPRMCGMADEFKFIIEHPRDIHFHYNQIQNGRSEIKNTVIWLHPEWSHREDSAVLNAISDAVKSQRNTFRAGWQIHKLYKCDTLDARSRTPVPLGGDPSRGY